MSEELNDEKTKPKEEQGTFGYKFPPDLKKRIYNYLQERPMVEVEEIIAAMFETENPDPFYTLEGVMTVTEYLKNKCPRREAKPLIIEISKELQKYQISNAPVTEDKKSE